MELFSGGLFLRIFRDFQGTLKVWKVDCLEEEMSRKRNIGKVDKIIQNIWQRCFQAFTKQIPLIKEQGGQISMTIL